MTPERWQKVDKLFEQALEQEPDRRGPFLDEACSGDEELRREVESQIARIAETESFFEGNSLEAAGKRLATGRPQSLVGRQIDAYKIRSLLGVGGMGEVYRAKDTRLGREVAVKVLPSAFSADRDRLRRFEQEARAAGQLNHPNILAIYDVGTCDGSPYIVSELLEGATLREQMGGHALSQRKAIEYAVQITRGLAAAHAKGIVHRDLKPENVFITKDDRVKILDFGLAKLTPRLMNSSDLADASTVPTATAPGVLMGTAGYMSPEQIRGQVVDHRSDIFSFGALLYEMLSGRRAFQANSAVEMMNAILKEEPPEVPQHHQISPALERIVQHCLEKSSEQRFQSASDIAFNLESLSHSTPASLQVLPARRKLRTSWAAALGFLVLILAGIAWLVLKPALVLPPSKPIPLTSYFGIELSPTFSPDGSQVAFSWNGENQDNFDIYVKVIDGARAQRLTHDPAPDMFPSWSPDGRQIAFAREGAVFVIEPTGGGERRVADIRVGDIQWTPDSKSLVVSAVTFGQCQLLLLSIETGRVKELTSLPGGQDFPQGDCTVAVSPDGLRLAFVRVHTTVTADLYLMPLTGGEPRGLTQREGWMGGGVTWTTDGREIVYSRFPSLWRRSVEAPPESPSKSVEGVDPTGASGPVISRPASGSPVRLAYERHEDDFNIWVKDTQDSSVSAAKLIASTRWEGSPQFSPDGRRIAFDSTRSGRGQIWIADSDGSNPRQLTFFHSGGTNSPRWSPDGKRIVFASMQNNNRDLYTVSADGGPVQRLTDDPSEEGRPSWSRDGRWIYCYSKRTGSQEIWKIPAKGGGKAVQVTKGGGHESFESPDGKLLYYEDYGLKGLRSIPTDDSSGPREGAVLIDSVRPGFWAVAEKGIYFVEFDDRYAASRFILYHFDVRQPIKFYDFKTEKFSEIGSIQKPVVRSAPSFSVTWDGRYIAWSQVDKSESDLMMIDNFR